MEENRGYIYWVTCGTVNGCGEADTLEEAEHELNYRLEEARREGRTVTRYGIDCL